MVRKTERKARGRRKWTWGKRGIGGGGCKSGRMPETGRFTSFFLPLLTCLAQSVKSRNDA